MYEVQFSATNSADWTQAVELIDNNTNLPLADIDDATFKLEVRERGCGPCLTASTDEGTITRPSPNIVQWGFPQSQLGALSAGRTYNVGLTMTTDSGTIQIFIGTLAMLNGVVHP